MARFKSKVTLVVASCIFLVACYSLYSSLDAASNRRKELIDTGKAEINHLEGKLKSLESDLQNNEHLINEIRGNIYKIVGAENHTPINSIKDAQAHSGGRAGRVPMGTQRAQSVRKAGLEAFGLQIQQDTCAASLKRTMVNSDVQMLDTYETLGFENPDGGAWKQGWNIQYDVNKVENVDPKLEIIVLPHSHCDPGWIKTFERYYEDQVRQILNGMVTELSSEKSISFIYAEMSFFERWWAEIDEHKRSQVKKLLESGKFEIVTGGWVMTDEANAHYFAMVDELIEGHQWLHNHLQWKPQNHWSIDPFGLSATIPYILKQANMSTMTIQRVHYRVKHFLAKTKQLEFMWRPLWGGSSDSGDILTHMFPFYSYDVPHTCGPEPKICCQFDFRRLPGMGMSCPWNVPPTPITHHNVEARAKILLDQYRKKAQLYRSNVVLIPLGDDFRYDTAKEWEEQYSNYRMIFDYINSNAQLNAHARFGTLADYFKALSRRTRDSDVLGLKPPGYPTLSGDFFTYADRDDHYWSGYYTSRPFYKRMDRALQHYVRGAEVAFSLSMAYATHYKISSVGWPSEILFNELVSARRMMALFQHHDGVTGTAKDPVVADYGIKMLKSLEGCKWIISASAELLLANNKPSASVSLDKLLFDLNDFRSSHDAVPEKLVIVGTESPRTIVFYNSLMQSHQQTVCLHVDKHLVEVKDSAGNAVDVQLNPVLYKNNGKFEISDTIYEICFSVKVNGLSMISYTVKLTETASPNLYMSSLQSNTDLQHKNFQASRLSPGSGADIEIESNDLGKAVFSSKSGLLQSLDGQKLNIQLLKYGTVRAKDKSGAYLFLPNGDAQQLPVKDNEIVVVRGPVQSYVTVLTPHLRHTALITHGHGLDSQSLSINNVVDIREEFNFELSMRMSTDISNDDNVYYTDLNGLQMIKRKWRSKIPLQGNFYPMPSAAYLEDKDVRLTILSGQPLGVASLNPGSLEVILDRRLQQDDNRGLFQGVTDNKVTPDHFKLLVEKMEGPLPDNDSKLGHLTLMAHHTSLILNHPVFTLITKEIDTTKYDLSTIWNGLKVGNPETKESSQSFPCDIHVVNLRTMAEPAKYTRGGMFGSSTLETPKKQSALILHRLPIDCRSSAIPKLSCQTMVKGQKLDMNSLLNEELELESVQKSSLTLMYDQHSETGESAPEIYLDPMDLAAFKVQFK